MTNPNPRELAAMLRERSAYDWITIANKEALEIAAALEKGADAIDALAEAITYVAHDKRCPADLRRECSCGLDGFLSGFGE